jgi:hypothetical protein
LDGQTERYRRPVGIYGVLHKLATLLEGLSEDDAYEVVKSTFLRQDRRRFSWIRARINFVRRASPVCPSVFKWTGQRGMYVFICMDFHRGVGRMGRGKNAHRQWIRPVHGHSDGNRWRGGRRILDRRRWLKRLRRHGCYDSSCRNLRSTSNGSRRSHERPKDLRPPILRARVRQQASAAANQ